MEPVASGSTGSGTRIEISGPMTNNVLRSRAYGYTLADMISRVDMEYGGKAEYTSDRLDRLTRE